MTVGRIGGQSAVPSGVNPAEDAISKNLKNQIANAQKKLQELSGNTEISMEEKMKRRQEIQQEIAGLNQELRQHEIDLRREKQQEQSEKASSGRQANERVSSAEPSEGLSGASQQAMLGADSAMKQAKAYDSVTISAEGRAKVLASEIELDKSRHGTDTARKEEELAETERRLQDAREDQMSALSDISGEIEDAREADRQMEETGEAGRKEQERAGIADKDKKVSEGEAQEETNPEDEATAR